MKGCFSRNLPGILSLKTCPFIHARIHNYISNVCAHTNYGHTHTYILAQVASRGSGGFLLACFQRLMWPGVFVCVRMLAHVCLCVCSQLCQFTVKSCQPPPLYLQSSTFLSLSSSSPSLSPMNRLNFLMSCFYGLLMLIHSSPYALSLHPSVSCCLPRLIHPFFPPPLSSPQPSCCNNVYIYRRWSTHMHTRSESPI